MKHKLLIFTCFLLFCLAAKSQQVVSKDSLPQKPVKSASPRSFKVYRNVQVEAEFPGGKEGWKKYLEKRLDPLVPVKRNAPPGRYEVIVNFIVSEDGMVTDVLAETKYGYGMEEEVKRIIKTGPPWVPALQNGKPVNAFRKQSVTFIVGRVGE